VILQPNNITFLLLLCYPVHEQQLLTATDVGIKLQQSSVGANFKCVRVLMEGFFRRIIAVHEQRNIYVGACALAPISLGTERGIRIIP